MRKQMKRVLSFALTTALILSLLAGCKQGESGTTGNNQSESVKLWYAYNTENLMKDVEYLELIAERDSTLRMHCVRNDVETVQLMITPSINVSSFDFVVADLKNANGDVLTADNFKLYAAWYVEVLESYIVDAYSGFYPDALVPLENYIKLKENFISAGQNQAIWVEVNVPENQAAGHYTGIGELDIDGAKHQVPIEVTIYDASLPNGVNVPSMFAVWYDYIAKGEGFYNTEIAEAYYDFLLAKRLAPTYPDPTKWSLGTEYDAFMQWVVDYAAEDPMVSCYSLPYKIETYELGNIVSKDGVKKLLTMMAEKNIELREAGNSEIDLFKKAAYYLGGIIDEPSGSGTQRVRDCDLIITEAKLEIANTYFKDKYPDLYESCIRLPHIVTSVYSPELVGTDTVGGVQTWCGQAHTWHSEAQRAELEARRESTDRTGGEGTWWYTCEQPRKPFVNFHMDDDTLNTRTIFWMMFDYDVEGMLYWTVNWYNSDDVWTTPVNYLNAVGDGMLCYPGAKYGILGPISTLRLENLREGEEDYECLLMLENAILAYNEENGTDYDPKELMAWIYAGLYEGVVPERDNAEGFAEQRIAMLEILEQFTTDPHAAINKLLNG